MKSLRIFCCKYSSGLFFSLAFIIALSGCENKKAEQVSGTVNIARQMINEGRFQEAVKYLGVHDKDISPSEANRMIRTAQQFLKVENAGQKGDLKSAQTLLKRTSRSALFSDAHESLAYKCARYEKTGSWPAGICLVVHLETEPAGAEIFVNNRNLGKSKARFVVMRGESFSLETQLAGYRNPISILKADKTPVKITLTPFSLDKLSKPGGYYPFAQKLVDELDIDNAVLFIGKYTNEVHGSYGQGMLRSVKQFQQAFKLYHDKKYDEALTMVQGRIGMSCCAYGQIYKDFAEKFKKAIELARHSEK